MKVSILDKYIAGKFLKSLAVVATFFNLTYLFIDFVGRYSTFSRHKAPAKLVLYYYLFRLPESLHYTLPFSTLIASMLTFSILKRNNEIMALRTCGAELKRIVASSLIVTASVSLLASLNAMELTNAMSKAREIYAYKIQREKGRRLVTGEGVWIKEGNNFLYLKGTGEKGAFERIIWIIMGKGFRPQKRIEGGPLVIKERKLTLKKGVVFDFTQENIRVELKNNFSLELPKRLANDIKSLITIPKKSFSDIFLLSKRGYVPRFHRSFVMEKISFSLSSIVFFLIGIMISLMAKTKARIGIEFGIALVLMFAYWMVHSFFFYFGMGHNVPPPLSTNVANVVFLTLTLTILKLKGERW